MFSPFLVIWWPGSLAGYETHALRLVTVMARRGATGGPNRQRILVLARVEVWHCATSEQQSTRLRRQNGALGVLPEVFAVRVPSGSSGNCARNFYGRKPCDRHVGSCSTKDMGFALWVDTQSRLAWAQGTHEYRPMGTAVIAITDQFRHRDFRQMRRGPAHLRNSFAGFFGSLEEVNGRLRSRSRWKLRVTPSHVR